MGLLLAASAIVLGQEQLRTDLPLDPKPAKLVPPPLTKEQQKHYQALKLFLRGQLLLREHRLPEALQALEDALKLEPDATATCKALATVCFQLDREGQALEYCRKALALDPNDFDLWFRYGQELKDRGRSDEAAEAFNKAVTVPAAKDHPANLAQMLYELGRLQEQLQHFDKAAAALEQVAKLLDDAESLLEETTHLERSQIDAEAAKAYERLGHVELQAKHYDEAVTAFRKAQEKDANRAARLNYNLAEVFLAQQQPKQALEALQRYLATQPGGTEAYERLIDVLKQLHRNNEIITYLEKAAEHDPFNQGLQLLLAEQYVLAGEPAKAEKTYLAMLADRAEESAYRSLAKLYQRQSRWLELVQRLEQDLRDPRQMGSARMQAQVLSNDAALLKGVASAARGQTQSGQALVYELRRILATLCRQAKLFDLAEHFCRLCVADDPQPGDAYLELCRILSEAEKPEAEVAACNEALTKKLKVPAVVFQLELARALSITGKSKEAIAAAQEALKQTHADSQERLQAEFNLIVVYYRCAELEKAASSAEDLLEKNHDAKEDRQLRHLLAGIYSAKHDAVRSEALLQKLLESDPNDAGACNDLGYQWAEQGKNLAKAEELIRKAIELERAERRAGKPGALDASDSEGDNAAYIDSLGWVLFKRGHAEDALKELERAGKLKGGDDPVIYEHLGDVYQHLGQTDKSKKAWKKSLELYDKSKRVGLDVHRQEVHDKLHK
jgi:tetratricopeptide (TPR) repeat protein